MTRASWRQLAEKFQRDRKAIRQAIEVIDWHVWHTSGTDTVLREIGDWRRGG
jgi:predicted transcriptional regulator